MQTNTNKEVSCKTLTTVFNAASEKNIDLNKLLVGLPYDLTYLLNKHERIEWYNWVKIYSNAREYFTPAEFEQMGRDYIKNGSYLLGTLGFNFMFSSNKISRSLSKKLFRMGSNDFSCINGELEYRGKNGVRIKSYLDDKYEFCPEFFYIAKGVWEQAGNQLGHKGFKVELEWIHQGVVFDVSWNQEGTLFYIKKWWRWLFNIKKAFLDLTDSHEELLNQYKKLEESKKLLQKQTSQLKTAYDIAKSIRQSLDINKTLNSITNALLNNSGLYSAHIKLFKDIEGNSFEVESFMGVNEKNIASISRTIIINNEKIGELKVSPKLGTDNSELNELLNYLLPIINISIHDSLVLQEVTDYKNNLEEKVNDRTAELKKAQDELSKTIHLLQQTQNAQNRFFTNISHEFRTPLTLILGPVKQIIEQTKNEKLREEAKLIHRSAKKLNRLADQLLDISRIEAGSMKLKANENNLVPFVKEIVSLFQSFAERKHISLKYNPGLNELLIYLDKFKFEKILSNILSNALKFTPEGGEVVISISVPISPVSIDGADLGLDSKRNVVEICIQDTGIGIPQNQTDKIFDRFYQVDNKVTREYEGTGVGLSLTKELVELHKGKISVESEEGKGTTFKIILPLGKEHLHPEEITEEEVYVVDMENAKAFILTESEPAVLDKDNGELAVLNDLREHNNPSLLIIEDNQDVRKYIIEILGKYYKIIEASDGEEGLAKALECIPDLVISDIMMPKLDGFQLCLKLKADARTSHIPVIMLTAKATLQDKINGLETGADDYLMKPFEEEELKARIKNLLGQRKRLHKHFQKYGLLKIEEKQVTSMDQKFLQKAIEIINDHISDSTFSIEMFAENLGVSRSLLHKKFIALIGESPGELLKRFRLNKAANLIELNSGNFTQIAFEVGFNDPSYFAACFRKQFGVSPSRYYQDHLQN